ncbi:hypothetical protein CPB86DRAFT_779559 [Serendipita vermifera]|nr:hypothetical protein CPB86DRAFT_779559 [Serendipita vermifera]
MQTERLPQNIHFTRTGEPIRLKPAYYTVSSRTKGLLTKTGVEQAPSTKMEAPKQKIPTIQQNRPQTTSSDSPASGKQNKDNNQKSKHRYGHKIRTTTQDSRNSQGDKPNPSIETPPSPESLPAKESGADSNERRLAIQKTISSQPQNNTLRRPLPERSISYESMEQQRPREPRLAMPRVHVQSDAIRKALGLPLSATPARTNEKQNTTTLLTQRIESLARELSEESKSMPTPSPSPPPVEEVNDVVEQAIEPSKTEPTSRAYMDHFILDSTNVRFGDGLMVDMVTTPSDPTHVTILGISPKVTLEEVSWHLRSVSKVIRCDLVDDEHGRGERVAKVHFAHHPEAAAAIEMYNEKPGLGTTIPLIAQFDQRIAPNLTSTHVVSDTVIFRWDVPTPKVRLYYHHPRDARQAAEVINMRNFGGKRLTATLRETQHVIIVEGVGWDADLSEFMRRHNPDREPTWLESHYNHPKVMEQMRGYIKEAKELRQLDERETATGVVMRAHFNDSHDAEQFMKEMDQVELPWRFAARLSMFIARDLLYVMVAEKFELLANQIEELRWKLHNVHLRLSICTPPGHSKYRHIRINGASHLSAYKPMIDTVLTGEVVMRDGKPLWDSDIELLYGSQIFTELPVPGAQIFVERWRRRIIVYGPEEERARAKKRVLHIFDRAKNHLFVHSFPRYQLRYYSLAVERFLKPECERKALWLDSRSCTVTVTGSRARECLKQIASNAPKREQPTGTTDLCPICLDEATEPQSLPCKHRPCRSCLTRYLSSATQPEGSFPLRCFGDEGKCNARIPLTLIRRLLNHDQLQSAMNRSFELYIHSRPQEYRYCPTSDCPQIYRIRPKSDTPELPEVCISCLAKYCPACFHEGGHGGYTCAEHQERMELEKEEENRIVEGWMRNMGGRSCPKCSIGLLKDGGCAHVQCARCKVHICWTCGKAFEQVADESVYEHMRREHGSIGLIDVDLGNWNEDDMVRELDAAPAAPQTPPRLQQRAAPFSRSRRNTGAQSLASSAGSSRASTSMQGRGQRNTGRGRANGRRNEHLNRSSSNRQENGRDSWSEDEGDEFDNTRWDYDFADMDWESLV